MSAEFPLLGDALWLEFVNTARGRTPSPPDQLPDQAAVERWCRLHALEVDPAPATFGRVVALRGLLTDFAEALDAGRQPPARCIAVVNELLRGCPGSDQLIRLNGGWHLRFAPARPPDLLGAIARSAAATLAQPSHRVRQCAGVSCSLFFTDDSPTGSRRWCDPHRCGRDAGVERRRGLLR
jgi:predicted RNA-binding Zn ribbon-like protein